ncbi:MAG TPA: hypothetical protein VLQ80_13955, partial [Candidatus Saccharimonadia bacterium]|nr:hypothetical protein [Candidatus Saccharimonadia bacterium]
RRRACHGDDVRFLLARQCPRGPRAGQRVARAKAGLDKPLAGTEDRGSPPISRGRQGVITQPVSGFAQNACARQLACARLPATAHGCYRGSFCGTEIHEVFWLGHVWALLHAGGIPTLPEDLGFIKCTLTRY